MFSLDGKTALVTGASGGIGSAIAIALAKAGARIALSGTNEGRLQETAAAAGGETHKLTCNLADRADVATLVPRAQEALGNLDILVNNAGITRDTLAMRMKDDDWDMVQDVNLRAAFMLSKAALRGMMKARFGRIISITSVVGVTGNAGQTNYAASKAGLIGMSKSLGQEVASRNITVNCIAPGFIRSAMTDALDEAQRERLASAIPAGRFGESEDIAAAALYLASDAAGFVTGQTLHVNGGMAMI
ncbi:MAG: 3-oxoacyl-[acyl-carrier-protein] reductase [Pseudomonadota bacterium]